MPDSKEARQQSARKHNHEGGEGIGWQQHQCARELIDGQLHERIAKAKAENGEEHGLFQDHAYDQPVRCANEFQSRNDLYLLHRKNVDDE